MSALKLKGLNFRSLCSGIFLVRQGQYILVNILAVLFSISGGSETNSKFGWVFEWLSGMEE